MNTAREWLPDDAGGFGQALLDALPTHIALLDGAARIQRVNAAWNDFAEANGFIGAEHGVGADYLAVCTASENDDDTTAREAAEGLRAVLAGELPHFSLEYPCHSPEARRWFRMVVAPLRQGEGDRSGAVVMHLDITATRLLHEQLQSTHRLEAIGQLTGGVAHDFNNLLTVVAGNAELLHERLADRPAERGMAGMILEAAQRGATLTQRLLAFSRKQALEPRPVQLAALVRGMERLVKRALGEDIELVVMAGDDPGHVLVDPSQMESALLNLCINARDAMPKGGHLVIALSESCTTPRDIDASSKPAHGDYLCLEIVDSGTGIEADILPRVVEPFFTTKARSQATGLGLSMAYGLVKQSGGFLEIQSQPGKGTSVRICLPRMADEDVARQLPAAEPVAPRGNEHILLVEDDALVRNYAYSQLMALGYHVLVADSARAALSVLERGDHFDLLFTDIMMPGGMNGVELAEAARKLRPGLRVLFSSGYSQENLARGGRVPEGIHLLAKPYQKQALAERVRQALATPQENSP